MTRRLLLSPDARDDVIQAVGYLAERSESAADRFWDSAQATFRQLTLQPMGERIRPRAAGLRGLRQWRVDVFENYLVFYQVHEQVIEIIRVLHAAQDWMTILEKWRRR